MTTTQSMSAFVDSLIMQGITWAELEARSKDEAVKRGIKDFQSLGALKRHIRHQKSKGWRIEEDENGVRGWPPAKPEKPKPMAKPKAKATAKKNGKAVGRKVAKTTNGGRQALEPVAEPEQTPTA